MSYKNLQHYKYTVHRYLDGIWLSSSKKRRARSSMYTYLSNVMGIPLEKTHVKYFTRKQCQEAIKILRPMYIQLHGRDLIYTKRRKRMEKLRIGSSVTFETAHILPEFKTDYGNLYSHSYTLTAELEGPVTNDYGMIMSYEELEQALRNIVPDHMFVYNKEDKISSEIHKILEENNIPSLALPFMISSEYMVKYFKEQLNKYITEVYKYQGIRIVRIEIRGTVDNRYAVLVEE